MKNKKLHEILMKASDRLFPEKLGEGEVNIDSRSIDGDTPLHIFIWGEETREAIYLINNGAEINAQDNNGETPLHIALRQNNMNVIKELMKFKAMIDIKSLFGKTAKDLAKEKGIPIREIE